MSFNSSFELREEKTHVQVTLQPGVIDADWASIEAFGSEVTSRLKERKKPACLIDLSPLDYMGSALVALIVRLWKVVNAENGKMIVVCPHPVVTQVIALAGLDKVWRIVPNLNIALKEVGARIETSSPQLTGGDQIQPKSKTVWRLLWPFLGLLVVIVVISILVIKTLSEHS